MSHTIPNQLSGKADWTSNPEGHIEIDWMVPFFWTKPSPGTYYDPPKGGTEIDGDPHPVSITLYPNEEGANPIVIRGIQDGSILDILVRDKYPLSDDDAFDAVTEHLDGAFEDTRW